MAPEQRGPVDPRFDPRFQRGYRGGEAPDAPGATHPTGRDASASTRPAAATAWPVAGPPPASPDVVAPLRPSVQRHQRIVGPPSARPVGEVDEVADERPDGVVEPPDAEPVRTGANPPLIALIAVSVLLVAGGIGLLWRQAFVPYAYGSGDEGAYFLETISYQLPPGLLTGGLVGLAIAGAALAVLGGRRRR